MKKKEYKNCKAKKLFCSFYGLKISRNLLFIGWKDVICLILAMFLFILIACMPSQKLSLNLRRFSSYFIYRKIEFGTHQVEAKTSKKNLTWNKKFRHTNPKYEQFTLSLNQRKKKNVYKKIQWKLMVRRRRNKEAEKIQLKGYKKATGRRDKALGKNKKSCNQNNFKFAVCSIVVSVSMALLKAAVAAVEMEKEWRWENEEEAKLFLVMFHEGEF